MGESSLQWQWPEWVDLDFPISNNLDRCCFVMLWTRFEKMLRCCLFLFAWEGVLKSWIALLWPLSQTVHSRCMDCVSWPNRIWNNSQKQELLKDSEKVRKHSYLVQQQSLITLHHLWSWWHDFSMLHNDTSRFHVAPEALPSIWQGSVFVGGWHLDTLCCRVLLLRFALASRSSALGTLVPRSLPLQGVANLCHAPMLAGLIE